MKQKTKNCLIATLSTLAISLGAFGWVNTATIQNVASAEAASSTVISLVEGAACRIRTADDEEQGSGIRFKAVLDRTQWTALAASNEMVAGIMILPTDYINVADGYTHEALDAAGKKYLDFTFTEEEVGEKSLLAASMVDILDQNYTRDFSGVAYLKSTTAFEGATEYNGAYYSYAEYTEEDNSRSIYEIAFAAYNDRSATKVTTDYENAVVFNENTSYSPYTDGQRNVLKGYLDGVVDLKKNAYADIVVANNTQYYTSPYTIKKESNADFVVNYDLSVEAKGMLFNGERIKELAFTDGKANVSLTDRVVLSENAAINADGSVTLGGRTTPGGYAYHIAQMDNSYIALEGTYGLGTYIDISFKGNNMPEVMFFADEINGNMTSMGGKGVLFSNGIANASMNQDFLRKYYIFGPNRISLTGGITDSDKQAIATNWYETSGSRVIDNANKLLIGYNSSGVASDYPFLTQKGLASTPDTEYKYTLGMYEKNGVVYAHIELHDITNGVTVYNFDQATTLSANNLTAGNIILYGSVAGTANTTTFSYSEPYTQGDEIEEPEETPEVELPANSGATFNDDGSVTLAGKASPGGYVYHVAQVDNSYVALEGEYGLDTYIDITFKGNNMPQVLFFADQINGNMTSMGGKGVLFSNGLVTANPAGSILRKYAIYGPNRIYLYGGITDSDKVVQNTNTYEGSDSRVINNANRILLGYDASGNVSDYPYLTQKGLATTPDVEYRYTLGMYENDGVVYAHIELYDLTNGATVYNINQATTLSASDLTAGSIILYGSVAGAATTTTFSYSEPYLDTGVTSNDDGSITLAGGESTSAGWMSGISESLNNSYFAFDGEYTIGTEVAFTFTGNNLPQVMLFADQINGDMSKLGGKGILLMNGLYVSNPPSGTSERYIGKNKLVCFGPNRIYDNYYTLVVQQDVCDVTFEDGYAWAELEDGVSYKYVVWTEEVEGEILVCVELYNAITLELLSKGSYDSNVSVNDITAGAIVVYAAVKGDGRNTTFFYDEPVMHAEKMEFYTYGTPGTYATEADLTTEEVLTDYLNSGMTTMVLSGESAFNGIGWSSSKTKALMDKAIAVGVEKFIINDTRLNDGLCIEGSLIGTGCKFASEAELDLYVENCITDYVNEKEFYGLILKDEPGYTYATSMGQLYRSIKRVAEKLNVEIYVQMNLHPLSDDAWDYYKATATSFMYEDYKDYLRLFLDGTGADMICVDKYPFMADGEFLPDYYACYKALAEVCAEYNAQFGFVLQSWTDTSVRTVSQEEMNLQMNAALAFGAKELSFFSYVPRDDGENESQSFIDINGNKTAVYDYAKNAIASAKQVANLLCDYDYVGSSTNDKSQESWFVDDTFAKLTYTSASWSVVTESYNDKTDSYLYTVINANVDTTAASTITLTFAGATQAYVLEDGVWSLVNLTNGTYTANVSLGEAIYIIPLA